MLVAGEGWLESDGLALQDQDGHCDNNMPRSQCLPCDPDALSLLGSSPTPDAANVSQ